MNHAAKLTATRISFALAIAGVAAVPVAAPAFAQAAAKPNFAAGGTVYDTSGGIAGTIAEASADAVVIDTGRNKVAIPPASFGAGEKGPILAMTMAELDAAADGAAAAAKAQLLAALVPGAAVKGSAGQPIGAVEKLDGEFVLLRSEAGKARVPVTALAVDGGALMLGMTAADFTAAVEATKVSDPEA